MTEKSSRWKSAPTALVSVSALSSAKSKSIGDGGQNEPTTNIGNHSRRSDLRIDRRRARDIYDEKQVYEIVADLLAGMTTSHGKINYSDSPMELSRLAS